MADLITRVNNNDPELTELFLGPDQFGPEEMVKLAAALENNTRVENILILRKNLGLVGGQALGSILVKNKSLLMLTVIDCQLGPDSGDYIAQGLQNNSTLISLELVSNGLGEGGIPIVEAVSDNTTLTILNLEMNYMGPTAAEPISNMLQHNTALTTLLLKGNLIDSEGMELITEGLKYNSSIVLFSSHTDQSKKYIERNIYNNMINSKTLIQILTEYKNN